MLEKLKTEIEKILKTKFDIIRIYKERKAFTVYQDTIQRYTDNLGEIPYHSHWDIRDTYSLISNVKLKQIDEEIRSIKVTGDFTTFIFYLDNKNDIGIFKEEGKTITIYHILTPQESNLNEIRDFIKRTFLNLKVEWDGIIVGLEIRRG